MKSSVSSMAKFPLPTWYWSHVTLCIPNPMTVHLNVWPSTPRSFQTKAEFSFEIFTWNYTGDEIHIFMRSFHTKYKFCCGEKIYIYWIFFFFCMWKKQLNHQNKISINEIITSYKTTHCHTKANRMLSELSKDFRWPLCHLLRLVTNIPL